MLGMIGKLNLNEIERPLQEGQVLTELENDWEPYIYIRIDNQSFLAYCDLGSMISTMPKMVYDYLKYENVTDHPHAHGTISKIKGIVKNVQVSFHNKTIHIDFMIMDKEEQGNIVLGRSLLKTVGCLINVRQGYINLYAPIRGNFNFPKHFKDALVESESILGVGLKIENT